MHPFRIDHHIYECQCERCDWPLYVGDLMFIDDERGAPHCSAKCAERTENEERAEAAREWINWAYGPID